MRVESIVIWSFLFVAGMSWVWAHEEVGHLEIREEERRGRRMDTLVDGWVIGKINDSSQLIGGSSWNWMWEEDKVEDVCRERKRKMTEVLVLKCTCKQILRYFTYHLVWTSLHLLQKQFRMWVWLNRSSYLNHKIVWSLRSYINLLKFITLESLLICFFAVGQKKRFIPVCTCICTPIRELVLVVSQLTKK